MATPFFTPKCPWCGAEVSEGVPERTVADHAGSWDIAPSSRLVSRLPTPTVVAPDDATDPRDDVNGIRMHTADVALAPPVDGMIEIGGPEKEPMSDLIARYLKAKGDARERRGWRTG